LVVNAYKAISSHVASTSCSLYRNIHSTWRSHMQRLPSTPQVNIRFESESDIS